MSLLLKNVLFTMVVPGTVAVLVPMFVIPHDPAGPLYLTAPAGILLAMGGAIYAWCLWDFASFGKGTPAPIDPPKYLVIRGLYRHSRNPMYLGVVCVIAGWALCFGSVAVTVYGLLVTLAFHMFVVFYEEPRLHRQFGSGYEEYRARVGRWFSVRLKGGA